VTVFSSTFPYRSDHPADSREATAPETAVVVAVVEVTSTSSPAESRPPS